MRVVVKTPLAYAVTLEEAKQHLGMEGVDTDDTLISIYLGAVVEHLDGPTGWLGRSIGRQSLEARYDATEVGGGICLPYGPVIELTSIAWMDQARVLQDVDLRLVDLVGDYVDPTGTPPWSAMSHGREALRISYTAGFSPVPFPIKAAILLMVGDLYRFRETVIVNARSEPVAMSATVQNLLSPYRRF